MRRFPCPVAAACLSAATMLSAILSMPARAEEPPDLARFDCTRTDDGKTVAGDKLLAQGFKIIARSRFGKANLMMVEPKSSVRANCFERTPAK